MTHFSHDYEQGIKDERKRIIELIQENAEVITNQFFYPQPLIAEPIFFLIALINHEQNEN